MWTTLFSCCPKGFQRTSASQSKNGPGATAAEIARKNSSTAISVVSWVVQSASSNRDLMRFKNIRKKNRSRSNHGNRIGVTFASYAIRSFFTVTPCTNLWVSFRFVICTRRAWRKSCRRRSIITTRLFLIYLRSSKRGNCRDFRTLRRRKTNWKSLKNANLRWRQPKMRRSMNYRNLRI